MTKSAAITARWGWLLLSCLAMLYWVVISLTTDPNVAVDGWGYYHVTADTLYSLPVGATGAFLYSPAIFQLMEPLRSLDFPSFTNALRLLELPALAWVAGPLLPLTPALYLPIQIELAGPNIQLLMTAAIMAGFRWPAAWSFVLLTKVTPGVGLVWFAVRREWRSLGIALGTAAVIAAVSFALAPGLWFEWIGRLMSASAAVDVRWTVPLPPLLVRLPIAALVIAWGARRNARWSMYVGAFLALPVPWISSLVFLLPALVELLRRVRRDLAVRRVRGEPIQAPAA